MIRPQSAQATHPTIPAESYGYDPVGNRLGTTVDAGNRLLEDGSYIYSYDANGNLIQKTSKATMATTTYTYDSENRLTQVSGPGMLVSYRYDPFGRRIEKDVNGAITRYVYDNEDIRLEYDGANQLVASYTHGPGIDEPLVMERGSQSYFYHVDGLGSVTAITDSAGNVAQWYRYDSFGNIVDRMNPAFVQPYAFTGREYDPESGLLYERNRYASLELGRYISEDPIGLAGGDVNFYVRVGNNPVNWIDPLGLLTDKDVYDTFGGPCKYYCKTVMFVMPCFAAGATAGVLTTPAGGFVTNLGCRAVTSFLVCELICPDEGGEKCTDTGELDREVQILLQSGG